MRARRLGAAAVGDPHARVAHDVDASRGRREARLRPRGRGQRAARRVRAADCRARRSRATPMRRRPACRRARAGSPGPSARLPSSACHSNAGPGIDRRIRAQPAVQPREPGALQDLRIAGARRARDVAAAVPDHLHRDPVRAQRRIVGDRLVEWEERVRRALHEQRRRADLLDERAWAVVWRAMSLLAPDSAPATPSTQAVFSSEPAVIGRTSATVALPSTAPATTSRPQSGGQPAGLHVAVAIQRRDQRVPAEVGHDRVDARVDRSRSAAGSRRRSSCRSCRRADRPARRAAPRAARRPSR